MKSVADNNAFGAACHNCDKLKRSATKHNSFADYDHDKHLAASRKGGIASGVVRRKKRELVTQEKINNTAFREIHNESVEAVRTAAKLLLIAKYESNKN